MKKLDLDGKIFDEKKVNKLVFYFNKFLKAQQLGFLNDISEFYLKDNDVIFLDSLESILNNYRELFCNPDSYEFDQENYDNNVEKLFPGFKKLFECFERFKYKLKVDYFIESDFEKIANLDTDSESESESDSDSDEIGNIIGSDYDSDSYSDDEDVIDDVNDIFNKCFDF